MDRFSVGRMSVHRVEEWQGTFAPPAAMFVGFSEEAWAPREEAFVPDHYRPDVGQFYGFLQSWVVDTGRQRILFDTGAGNDKDRPGLPIFGNLQTDFLDRLAAAGFEPGDIDTVVCSHLHIDHVGWNTRLVDGRWEPTFRNARYILPSIERAYWDPANTSATPSERGAAVNTGVFEDSVAPLLDGSWVEWADDGHEIESGVSLVHAPGHTPGHMAMRLASDDERALFVGDVVHHPIQVFEPDWNSMFCEDPDLARATRRAILEEAVTTDALLVPAHFGGQHAVRVVRDGSSYRPILKKGD